MRTRGDRHRATREDRLRRYAGRRHALTRIANQSWATWDELLNDPLFQNAPNRRAASDSTMPSVPTIRTTDVSNADAGAGTYADGFPDSSNEKKEWFMRFSNLFSLQSTSFQFVVAGLVYKDQPWDSVTWRTTRPSPWCASRWTWT